MMDADSTGVPRSRLGDERTISPRLDEALELLSNRRRRYALYHLRRRDEAVSLAELAARIAEWEEGTTDEAAVRADLYHSHLPRLADAGVVAFDPEMEIAELASQGQTPLSKYLDLAADEENVA